MDILLWHLILWIPTFSMERERQKYLTIRIVDSNVHGLNTGTNGTTSRFLNSNVHIEHSETSDGSPFAILSSIHRISPVMDDLVIVGRNLCDVNYMTSLKYLSQTSVICHQEYTSVPDLNSLPKENGVTSGVPCDTYDVFGDLSTDAIVRMLPVLLDELGWKHVIVFHDEQLSETLSLVYNQLSPRGVQFVAHVINESTTSEHIHALLRSVYNETIAGHSNFLIVCQTGCYRKLLSQADVFDVQNGNGTAMWKFSKWLVYEREQDCCFDANIRVNNIAKITLPVAAFQQRSGEERFYDHVINIFKSYNGCNLVKQGDNETLVQRMIQLLEENRCWQGRIDTLLYKDTGREFAYVGDFNIHGELDINHSVFPNVDFGFNMRTLAIGSNVWPSWFTETNTSDVGYEGLCIDLLLNLATSLNFTYTIVIPADGEWGHFVNGSWTGLIRGLMEREMDMVVAPLAINVERQAVIDFSMPFFYDNTVGIYRLPDPNADKWYRLIKPFKGMVFACLGISMLSVSILLCGMEINYFRRHDINTKVPKATTLQDSTWYIFGAMLAHGGTTQPQSESGRVLVGFWWLFCIVIAASYSGTLIAFLTVNKETPPFTTMSDITGQSDYTWGTIGRSSYVTYLQAGQRKDVEELWERMEKFAEYDPEVLSRQQEVHKRKVLAGNYIFFSAEQDMAMWSAARCNLAITTEKLQKITYAIGVMKKSPILGLLSNAMLRIDQHGLFLAWKRKWLRIRNTCVDMGRTSARSIALIDLQSAFYVNAIGMVLSTIVLLFEIALNKYRQTGKTVQLKV